MGEATTTNPALLATTGVSNTTEPHTKSLTFSVCPATPPPPPFLMVVPDTED